MNETSTAAPSLVILLPGLVCGVALCFLAPARVFRNIVLPVVLLCPLYFNWKIKMLPPVDFGAAVIYPLGFAMLLRCMSRWRFSLVDLWVVLFAVSSCVADLTQGQTTNAGFELFGAIAGIVIPYMAGKLLIEQDNGREPFVARSVGLLSFAAILSAYEWHWKNNLFRLAFTPFFQDEIIPWHTQLRGGHGRISGPYAQGELAGMMFLIAVVLCVYLASPVGQAKRPIFERPTSHLWPQKQRSEMGHPRFWGTSGLWRTVAAGILLVSLYLTQSRGPELGVIVGLPIAWIGRTRHLLRNSVLVAVLLMLGGGVAYEALSSFAAAAALRAPTADEQETAAYRLVLLELYLPMAEHGGPWGAGPGFKTVGKYTSIDNEYLLVWLSRGYVGLASFLLIAGGTLYRLACAIVRKPLPIDRSLGFTLLGIFLGLLFTIATVFLGMQPLIFFFLIVGWAQALGVYPAGIQQPVFEQVYT